MGLRIADKAKECRLHHRKWLQSSSSLESRLPLKSRFKFRAVKKTEMDRVWTLEKENKLNKLKRATITIPEVYAGIMIGNDNLDKQFGDPTNTPVILDNIVATENMLAYI